MSDDDNPATSRCRHNRHFGLGGVLYNRGDHAAGLEELRTAYSLAPDDPEIRAAYQKLLEK